MRTTCAIVFLLLASSCQTAGRVGLPGAPAAPTVTRAPAAAAPAPAPSPAAAAATPAPAPVAAAPIVKPGPAVAPGPRKFDLHAHSAKAHLKTSPGAYEVDDVVLAHRYFEGIADKPVLDKEWSPGTIVKVDGETLSLKFFSDGDTQQLPAKLLKPFDWKAQTKLTCVGRYGGGRVVEAPAGEEVRVAYKNPDEEKTFPIVSCSEAPHWYDTLHPNFTTNRAKYARLAAPPRSVSDDPPSKQVAGAFSYKLGEADGGGYLQIQKCYVTSKWADLGVGSRHTARRAEADCVVGVPAREEPKKMEACLVMSGACEQKYLGGGRYAGCVWEWSPAEYKTIDCDRAK